MMTFLTRSCLDFLQKDADEADRLSRLNGQLRRFFPLSETFTASRPQPGRRFLCLQLYVVIVQQPVFHRELPTLPAYLQ